MWNEAVMAALEMQPGVYVGRDFRKLRTSVRLASALAGIGQGQWQILIWQSGLVAFYATCTIPLDVKTSGSGLPLSWAPPKCQQKSIMICSKFLSEIDVMQSMYNFFLWPKNQ
jgi:hypothetical protein